MKPIKQIIATRQIDLFANPSEKGSSEWVTFSTIRDDTVDSYRVAMPRRPIVLREPHRVLRIVYPRHQRLGFSAAT